MIGIIFVGDIRFCPYLEKYILLLNERQIPYEVIFWDRNPEVQKEYKEKNIHVFKKKSRYQKSPFSKIGEFVGFSRFVQIRMKEKKFDKLILLSTLSAIILYPLLMSTFKNKYIFDYRDLSYEHVPFFKHFLESIVKNSSFTCISSIGFERHLPVNIDYVLAHNFTYSEIDQSKNIEIIKKELGSPLVVSYFGFIRGFDNITKIIDKFSQDTRFILNYHGSGTDYEAVAKYVKDKRYSNVYCTGFYDANSKKVLMKETDIINNYYALNRNIECATSNKLYDGLIYKKPQFVSKGSFDEKNIEKYGVGCALDLDHPEFLNDLFQYYHSLDEIDFTSNAIKALKTILEDDKKYLYKIAQFLNQ